MVINTQHYQLIIIILVVKLLVISVFFIADVELFVYVLASTFIISFTCRSTHNTSFQSSTGNHLHWY